MLQTRERLLHSTAENSDFNMAGYAFEPVRDMPVVSDYHPVERDQFQAPAPPSDRVGVTGVRVGVRRGRLSKQLVMANHTHIWWYNMLPLSD